MTPRTLLRPLAALTTALLVALFATPAAMAATSDVSFVAEGPGWGDVVNGTEDAGSYDFVVNGEAVSAYCVQMNEEFSRDAAYGVAAPSDVSVANIEIAAWLAANHATVPTPAANTSDEHAAVQVAIWHYTDGVTVDETTVPNPNVRPRALALIAAAASQSLPLAAADTEVTLSGAADGNEVVWTATAISDGEGTEGAELTITSGDTSTEVTTGADGTATVRTPRAATGTTSATANWTVVTGPGAVLTPDDGGQLLVTGTPGTATRTASANVEAQAPAPPVTQAPTPPVEDTTPTPPAANPPAATTSGTLPRTGGTLGWDQALVAAALLALGGAALIRRRRSA